MLLEPPIMWILPSCRELTSVISPNHVLAVLSAGLVFSYRESEEEIVSPSVSPA